MTQRRGGSEGGAGLERGGTGGVGGKGEKKENGKSVVGVFLRVSGRVLGMLPGQPQILVPLARIVSEVLGLKLHYPSARGS